MSGKRADKTAKPAPPRLGLLVSELLPNTVYVCRLSFLRVLVLQHTHSGPDPTDPRRKVNTTVTYGLYYSAVYGTHMRMTLYDGLLMHAPGNG